MFITHNLSLINYNFIILSDQTRLSVWVLDGEPGHANLLKYALNSDRFPNTLVMLVAAMTTPWAILDQLQSWSRVLGDHIDKLATENDSFKQIWQECRQQSQFISFSFPLNFKMSCKF